MPHPLENKRWRQIAVILLIAGALTAYVNYPNGRLYWPFLLSSYLLGVFVYLQRVERGGEKRTLLGYLFPKEIWLHPSAMNDYMLVLINFGVFWLFYRYISSLSPDVFQGKMRSLLEHFFPHRTVAANTPNLSVTVLYVVAAMLTSELCFYFSHRLQHKIPFLWEFHKVHHSAEVMMPLTANRLHPVEILLNLISRNFGIGLVATVFLFFYPDTKTVDIIAASAVGLGIINIAGGNLQHSHIWLRFPHSVERLITSPAVHQIHHSRRKEHIDRNFGTILTFWDWVFGSLYIPKNDEEGFSIGIRDGEDYRSLSALYILPLKRAGARLRRTLTNN